MRSILGALALTTRISRQSAAETGRWMAAWLWIPGLFAGLIWFLAVRIFGATALGMVMAVGGEAVLTAGMDWRGFAKTFDGWTVPLEERSARRRSASLGIGGVLMTALALFLFWSGFHHGGNLSSLVWFLPPFWARAAMAWGLSWRHRDPSDREYDQVIKATQGGTGSWVPLVLALGVGVLILGFEGVNVFGISLIVTGLFLLWARKLFQGMNRDVLGAGVILMEILAVILLVAFSAPL